MNTGIPTTIYAESTPNPASMKFVANKHLYSGTAEFLSMDQTSQCPFAAELLAFDEVTGVFISSNFFSVTKTESEEWIEIMNPIREFITTWLNSGKPLFEGDPEVDSATPEPTSEIDKQIISVLDEYVRPAVEGDGGAILFKSFEDGVVTLMLKGACSGCPSSQFTLKAGVENVLKTMVPGVKEVVAEAV